MNPESPESPECREWADAWRSHRDRSSLESNLGRAGIPEEAFWSRYATWVAAMQGDYPGILLERVRACVGLNSTVLDVGAGAGAFAIPLATTVRHVTAVEPSPAQVASLNEAMEREHVRNITIIESTWEDVDADSLEPHDLVLAVHSLQMRDIAGALRKMCLAASHRLILVHNAGHDLARLLQDLCGIEPGPDHTYIERILYGLGYQPEVEFADYSFDVPLDLQLEILSYNPGLNAEQCSAVRDYADTHGVTTVRAGRSWMRRTYRDALISVTSR
jgi:SAM-dependent methyltransferase